MSGQLSTKLFLKASS